MHEFLGELDHGHFTFLIGTHGRDFIGLPRFHIIDEFPIFVSVLSPADTRFPLGPSDNVFGIVFFPGFLRPALEKHRVEVLDTGFQVHDCRSS